MYELNCLCYIDIFYIIDVCLHILLFKYSKLFIIILDMRKEVAEMTVDERSLSLDTEDEESSSISPVKPSIHIKENIPFIYPSSPITDVSFLDYLILL